MENEVKTVLEVPELEKLYDDMQQLIRLSDDDCERYLYAITLYGEYLSGLIGEDDHTIGSKLGLHRLYLKTVYRFIKILKKSREYDNIIHVCRLALDTQPLDEKLNYELMLALIATGKIGSAIRQYGQINEIYEKYFETKPPQAIMELYSTIMESCIRQDRDILSICEELKKATVIERGPFVCDYSIFNDIYYLQRHSIERQNKKMFIALFNISRTMDPHNPIEDNLVIDSVMLEVLKALKHCLRKGDVISRFSLTQYVALFPMEKSSDGQSIINRVKDVFYKNSPYSNIRLTFQVEKMD